MPLTDEQLEHFQREGYVVVHNFFDAAEVKVIQAELDAMREKGLGRNVATDGDGQTESTSEVNLQIIPLSPNSDVYRSLPYSEKVREVVGQLIGDAFILQLDQIFLKPAGHGAGTSWHQDNHYFGIPDPAQGVGMWVAVHDATVANGTMHVVPRSHENVLEHIRDHGSDHHFFCKIDEEKEDVVPVEMKAGGALFFNYGVAHCTKGNHTDGDRAGLALHFLKESLADDVSSGKQRLRPILNGPNSTKGENEYGEVIEGVWERLASEA